MIVLAEINFWMEDSSQLLGSYAVTLLTVLVLWQIVRWFINAPKTPDPWDANVAAEMALETAKPVCPHCLTVHEELEHFCPRCGAAVGGYTNVLPFDYLFSIGHTLRIGTSETFKRSRFLTVSFFFLGLAQYSIFAPLYWFRLLKNLNRMDQVTPREIPVPASDGKSK